MASPTIASYTSHLTTTYGSYAFPRFTTSHNLGPLTTPVSFPQNCFSNLYDLNKDGLGPSGAWKTQGCAISTCCPSNNFYTEDWAWMTSYYSPGVCPSQYQSCSPPTRTGLILTPTAHEKIVFCCPRSTSSSLPPGICDIQFPRRKATGNLRERLTPHRLRLPKQRGYAPRSSRCLRKPAHLFIIADAVYSARRHLPPESRFHATVRVRARLHPRSPDRISHPDSHILESNDGTEHSTTPSFKRCNRRCCFSGGVCAWIGCWGFDLRV
jgi:hypothetical protein